MIGGLTGSLPLPPPGIAPRDLVAIDGRGNFGIQAFETGNLDAIRDVWYAEGFRGRATIAELVVALNFGSAHDFSASTLRYTASVVVPSPSRCRTARSGGHRREGNYALFCAKGLINA